MTILIKLLLSPLTAKQIASTKAMSRIQPKMKELQARYKDDKVTLNQKLSELYKKRKSQPGRLSFAADCADAHYDRYLLRHPGFPVCRPQQLFVDEQHC